MNHDYEHCIDFKDDCPESCHRAQLVRDLEENYPEMRVSWMNFGDFPECERNRLAKNSPKAANNIDDQISRSEIVSALKERAETLKGIYGDIGGACSGAAKLAESMPPATYTKIKPPPDYARIIAHLPEEKDVPDTNVGDMISRQSVVYALERTKRIARNNVNGAVLRTFEEVLDSLINITNLLPPVQHEITHEQAVDYLQSTGWMQKHDRQMMLDGARKLPGLPKIIYCKDCRKHNKKIGFDENYHTVWKEDACPLVSWRGKAQGHEFDYQFCAFADKRKEVRAE